MMTPTELREWAKQEVAEGLEEWLRDRLTHVLVIDEREALRKQINMARKAIGAKELPFI